MNKENDRTFQAAGGNRITGYDAARGLAVILMIIINFNGALTSGQSYPSWLASFIDLLDRRAAVAFVMLAGAGTVLLSKNHALCSTSRLRPGSRRELVHRSLFLFFTGTLLYTIWAGDILHFYAFYIFAGIFLLNRSAKFLFSTVIFLWIFSFIPIYSDSAIFNEGSIENILIEPFQDLLFTGYYPVMPWIIFFISGIWLGRQPVNDPVFIKKLAAAGFLMVLLTGLLHFTAHRLYLQDPVPQESSNAIVSNLMTAALILSDTDINSLSPLSVFSGIGSGILVIMTGMFIARRFILKPDHSLMIAGRTSLTLYISHIILIVAFRSAFHFKDIENIWIVLIGAGIFFSIYIRLLRCWLRYHHKGPVETIMRRFLAWRVSGPPSPVIPS